jgi:hypothetical protein
MKWGNDILGRIDGLIASYLGEKCRPLLIFRPIFSKNDTLSVHSSQFRPPANCSPRQSSAKAILQWSVA